MNENENKEEVAARHKATRVAKKEALLRVLDYVVKNVSDTQLLKDVRLVTPGFRTSPVTSSTLVIDEFIENNSISEDDIWGKFKLGRPEMRRITINLIKQADSPEERMWISFNPSEGVYTVEGVGAEAPDEWTGYRPATIEDMEIV